MLLICFLLLDDALHVLRDALTSVRALLVAGGLLVADDDDDAVSYTHLTLPTIYSV